MGTADIRLARVDNRLIHGQVAMYWTSKVQANVIIVVDDHIVNDQYQIELLKSAAPENVQTRFFTVQKMIDSIDKASPNQHLFIVTRTPIAMAQLIKAGLPIKEVNVGNMHNAAGKVAVIPEFLFANPEEINALKEMCEAGVHVYGRMSPITANYDLNQIMQKF